MDTIICANDTETIINNVQEYLKKNSIIKYIKILDKDEDKIVIIISFKEMNENEVKICLSGLKAALKKII